jgi:AraC family transcriptional regulator
MLTPYSERILRVLDHIHAHLDEELAPDDLARRAGLSLHHFHRVFRGMVGESVMGHVRRLRLERAAFRLKHGGGEVLPVALAFGYESHEAFTRAFRAHFGVPPSVFRDRHRDELPAASFIVRHEPSRVLLCRPHVGDYAQVGEAWDALFQALPRFGVTPTGPALGLVYDDPDITPAERCRYDAAIEVPAGSPAPEGFALRTLPAGRFAVAVHVGPHDTILDTYVALLGRHVPRLDEDLADAPVVERSLQVPGTVPDAELHTEVMVRLA